MWKILAKNMERYQSSKELRLTYKQLRDEAPTDLRNSKSRDIVSNVLALLESDFKGANIFLCYYPFGSEIDLLPLYEKLLDEGKSLYFPISDTKNHLLHFYQIFDLEKDFHVGAYNILEPNDTLKAFEYDIDQDIICVTPGLIFDRAFNRIGYGAGFYDRFLYDKPNIIKLAPCFESHLLASIPSKVHDIKMDIIITENEVLKGDKL